MGINDDQLLCNYGYQLPPELIAQTPAVPRDRARLMVINSLTSCTHSVFYHLPNWLRPGDLLVLNNTRVIPARLYGYKLTRAKTLPNQAFASGAAVEILLLEARGDNCWLALVKPGKRLKLGTEIVFTPTDNSQPKKPLTAEVVGRDEATGGRILQFMFPSDLSFEQILKQYGQVPLPPYITEKKALPEQYQTVFAQRPGAVAAPTAGLHFTDELLNQLKIKGIEQAYLTLHVGVGTFRPVETDNITQHTMHQEWVELSPETAAKIEATRAKGGRIIAVGTTVVRGLEAAASASAASSKIQPFCGKTNLFIYPGYRWRVVDGLITNFHLPYSSLLMLVSALIGRKRLLALYQEAIANKYRFYSFGDAMLILPEAKLQMD